MKSYKVALIVCLVIFLIASVTTVTYAYYLGKRIDKDTHQLIDVGSKVQTKTIDLVLTENDITRKYPITCYMTIKPSANTNTIFYSSDSFIKSITVDKSKVKEALQNFSELTPRTDFRKAYITSSCNYIPTEQGNHIDYKELETDLKKFPNVTTFDLVDYYVQHDDTTADTLHSLISDLQNCEIIYSNGNIIKALDMEPHYNVSDNSISFNEVKIKEVITNITRSYDNVGSQTYPFTTTSGNTLNVKSGTWGTLTDTSKEIEQVTAMINKLISDTDRIPICKQNLPSTLPSTYIEVDKENQHVYVYENNQLIMDSDCVTGLPPKRTTPAGVYFISEQQKNKTLRGPGYSSFVNRWMRLTNSGIGLHDATWRGVFGGDIYLHNGSHGCINLPKQFAYDLYDWTLNKNDVCVVIY